jgi:RNA polymerase sigma-70 factor (ECF subfamily)
MPGGAENRMSRPDSAEFARLLSEHRDALYRFARQMCWERSRADDVLQEAVLAAFQRFDRFQAGTNFKAWIFRFLVNTLLNENRRFRKELDTVDGTEVGETAPARGEEDSGSSWSVLSEPDKLMEQLSDPLKKALDGLSTPERMVFLLSVIENFRHKEISDLLGIPEGTAMSHLFRGKAKLREKLADYAREHGYGGGPPAGGDGESGPPDEPRSEDSRVERGRRPRKAADPPGRG